MGGKIIGVVFVLIIVLGVGLYIYNSGALGQGINFLKSIAPLYPTSSYGGYAPPVVPYSGSSAGSSATISAAQTSSINPADIPTGFTADQLSPYFHEVRFGGVSAGPPNVFGATGYGQISLYAYLQNQSSTVDVTGWEVRANRGGEYIPQAVDIYDPLGLNPPSDIFLEDGDTLNIYSTSAPVNLRLNECIGYLPNRNQFNPPLPQTCPYIDSTGLQAFSGACQNYITSLNGCQEPDLSSPQIPAYDYSCKQYLTDRFNYHWCFDTYFSDPNFRSNQVDVWMGSSPLDQYHDQVELLDRNGLLVDYYLY